MKLEELVDRLKLPGSYESLKGHRQDFIDTWLVEMPSGSGRFETFSSLEYVIKDLKKHIKPTSVSGDLFRIVLGDVLYYWYEKDEVIQLATELHNKAQGIVISITGKNPSLKGSSPYASDLYVTILKNTDKNIRLVSDEQLSDEGYSLWKKLLKLGHKVSMYNSEDSPGQSLRTFNTPEEMDEFFKHDDINFKKYQYVLSEDVIKMCEVRGRFNSRRARELINESNPRYTV